MKHAQMNNVGAARMPARRSVSHSARLMRMFSIYLAAWAVLAAPPPRAAAISCPAGGSRVQVCIDNTTSATPTVTISGQVAYPGLTCTGSPPFVNPTYSMNVTLSPNGLTCVEPAALYSGVWVHHINVAATGQSQHQQNPVFYTSSSDPADLASVSWKYFPNVITVNQLGDSSCNTSCVCTSCSGSNCTLRQAIVKANATAGAAPVLVQFAFPEPVPDPFPTDVNPVEIELTDTCPLRVERNDVMIDGTDMQGNPWIVGDRNAAAAGSQDPFTRTVDLNDATSFRIAGAPGVTIKGLRITNTIVGTGAAQKANLIRIESGSPDATIRAVKLEGGNTLACGMGGCGADFDLIDVAAPGARVINIEGHSAIDKGVKAISGGNATVDDSWLHHNYRGGVESFGSAGPSTVTVNRGVVEHSGRRITDNEVVRTTAGGLLADGGGFVFMNSGILWLNQGNGTTVNDSGGGGGGAILADSFVCGNRTGLEITNSAGQPAPTALISGNAFVYNTARGFSANGPNLFVPFVSNNAFANNDNAPSGCDFKNDSPISINAENNQWGTTVPRVCGSGAALVDTDPVQEAANFPIHLSSDEPTSPSNVIFRGQSIRINGNAFNAIKSNPPVDSCVRGDDPTSSCCLAKPMQANACSTTGVHNPVLDSGTCVEFFQSGNATWKKMTVTSVTPTTIVTEVPEPVFSCIGNDAELWVSDRPNTTLMRQDSKLSGFCTNRSPALL